MTATFSQLFQFSQPKPKPFEIWLDQQNIQVLELPSQSPDLTPMENVRGDLKYALHARIPEHF